MTLPQPDVLDLLADAFVLGARNIEKDGHVGMSHGYRRDQTAIGTTNGAGGRNVQLLVLAADETVVHALPGFWHAEDLLPELRLGLALFQLYRDEQRTPGEREAMFRQLHRAHLHRHGAAAAARGAWQAFDAHHELRRKDRASRDTIVVDAAGKSALKDIPQLVHERLLARPFRSLAAFDMESFVDYGEPFYDNNRWIDRGREFAQAERANRKREQAKAKAERAALADARR